MRNFVRVIKLGISNATLAVIMRFNGTRKTWDFSYTGCVLENFIETEKFKITEAYRVYGSVYGIFFDAELITKFEVKTNC